MKLAFNVYKSLLIVYATVYLMKPEFFPENITFQWIVICFLIAMVSFD